MRKQSLERRLAVLVFGRFLGTVTPYAFMDYGRKHPASSKTTFVPICWIKATRAIHVTRLFESTDVNYPEADNLPSIQQLFNKYCDEDGLMTKVSLMKMPPFSELLTDKDLEIEELNDIWDAAPKFPDVTGEETRIDVDSFVQIYRDVDDLFEEDGNEKYQVPEKTAVQHKIIPHSLVTENGDDGEDETVEAELELVYESLCDKAGFLSKSTLKRWVEVQKLFEEGLLGDDEFEEIWEKTPKSPGSAEELDVDGFLSFNVALDGLFEFEDDEEYNIEEKLESREVDTKRSLVESQDMPPGVLFSALANEDYMVGMKELKLWSDLQDMLEEGDLLPSELQSMFDSIDVTKSGKLSEDGFTMLYEAIYNLFEEVEVDNERSGSAVPVETPSERVKKDLLKFLDIIQEEEALPCGLECNEKDQKQVLNIVGALEEQPNNLITQRNGRIDTFDLVGTWELLYSSSNAMRFNKGLSGLGGSFPNGKFAGLKQKLTATKFVADVEYTERIEVQPSTASFDVTVNGNWNLRSSMSLFTGKPSIILEVEPDRVKYGPTSTRADHWKSLGPMNMLDLTYLDEDLRVMRGCTSSDTVFIFKRSS